MNFSEEPLTNSRIAELLAIAAEEAPTPLKKAYRRASRKANGAIIAKNMFPVSASDYDALMDAIQQKLFKTRVALIAAGLTIAVIALGLQRLIR